MTPLVVSPAKLRPGDTSVDHGSLVVKSVTPSDRVVSVYIVEFEGQPDPFFMHVTERLVIERPETDDDDDERQEIPLEVEEVPRDRASFEW